MCSQETTQQYKEAMPQALKSLSERAQRLGMLEAAHMKPLTSYLKFMRQHLGPSYDIPNFDPLDGGTKAGVLVLLETPGKKALESGFVSRDNPDQTASNLRKFLEDAEIPRENTLFWNIVPWYLGNETHSKIHAAECRDIIKALPYLGNLLPMLPRLRVIVLAGNPAQSARPYIETQSSGVIVEMPHPSPVNMRTRPEQRKEAAMALEQAHQILVGSTS